MAKETVLLYNCGGDEFKTLRALLMMLRVRVRMVEPSRYHLPLESRWPPEKAKRTRNSRRISRKR